MTEKTLDEMIENYKEAIKNKQAYDDEFAAVTTKIEQYKADLQQLQEQRESLESKQSAAPGLMIKGQMSDKEFTENKKTLFEIYSRIDEVQALLEAYEKGLNRDLPNRARELNQKKYNLRNMLRGKIAENLALEIAELAGQQIKELLALLPSVKSDPIGFNPNENCGLWIATALYGGKYDEPKAPPKDEQQQLLKIIHDQLGV